MRSRLNPTNPVEIQPKPVVGVLLPLPLAGAYDYKLPPGVDAPRGTLVAAPLGNREVLGAVWGAAEGTVGDNRLKTAEPLDGGPHLPEKLCDFIDWVADYTLNPPGAILAMALRSRGALLIAFIARAVLLASNTVSFHSDEAVVALMARHILQGERPVFFYGQAYMGSLDAWLVAIGFQLLGESVLTIRFVQACR